MADGIVNNIFSVNEQTFTDTALQVFRYQYLNNDVYRTWVTALNVNVEKVERLEQIPFLPISFFKSHQVKAGDFEPTVAFESSGTTATINSKHYVKDIEIYRRSFTTGFEKFYGNIKDICIIGLLPSYLERKGSSLIMMVDELIGRSANPLSGFYLYNFHALANVLQQLEKIATKTILIGVTFALLDFAERYPIPLSNTIVMETGGMKGRRKEMVREEVHELLKNLFNVNQIHSEYGMTELLSQAYSLRDGKFEPVPWMKILVRDEEDPLNVSTEGRGVLNIIDLANIHSCSFIATDDVGSVYNNSFEVAGRIDSSDIRGCSLMVV